MPHHLFVWDFHGTLEKGNVRALHTILNQIAGEYDLPRRISFEETVKWYGLSWVDYFRHLNPGGSDKQAEELKQRAYAIQEEDHVIEKHIQPMDHADSVLKQIRDADHTNIIMSNSRKDHISWFVSLVGLEGYFEDYIGLDSHSEPREHTEIKKLKAGALKEYIASQPYDRIIKIGDRQSDIEAGKAVGAVTYLFRNEYNAREKMTVQPDHEITDLRAVVKELE